MVNFKAFDTLKPSNRVGACASLKRLAYKNRLRYDEYTFNATAISTYPNKKHLYTREWRTPNAKKACGCAVFLRYRISVAVAGMCLHSDTATLTQKVLAHMLWWKGGEIYE